MQISDQGLLKSQAYVNGEWIDADNGGTIPVTNPADGSVVADVAKCGTAETRRAIEAAERAQRDWQKKTAKEREAGRKKSVKKAKAASRNVKSDKVPGSDAPKPPANHREAIELALEEQSA